MQRFKFNYLLSAMTIAYASTAIADTDVFYYDLSTGRTTFDNRVTSLGSTVNSDKLTGLVGGTDTWVRSAFTITAPSNRSVNQYFTNSSVADNDGLGIQMTAATLGGNTPGTLSASGLSFTFNSAVNAFAVELGDWATCCYPTALYISFDDGTPILVGSASSSANNPGYNDGITTFIGAIDDSGTFTKVTFWGEASGGDVLYGGGVIRWALLRIGALSGNLVTDSVLGFNNSNALGAAKIIDQNANLANLFAGITNQQSLSDAATQTLPLLQSNYTQALKTSLNEINNILESRQLGASSGDLYEVDKNFWFKPFASWATQDDKQDISGYDANTYGIVAGLDREFANDIRLGLALSYARSDVDGNSRVARHSVDVDTYRLSFYGNKYLNTGTNVFVQADIGRHNNEGKRQIAFTNSTARADFDSWSSHIGAGAAHPIALSEKVTFTPSLRADYTHIRDESYREKGAGLLNLDVDSNESEAFVLSLDGKLSKDIAENASVYINGGVDYDFINDDSRINAAFAGAPTASFRTDGIKQKPWGGHVGVGVVGAVTENLTLTAGLSAEFKEGYDNKTASAKFNWNF